MPSAMGDTILRSSKADCRFAHAATSATSSYNDVNLPAGDFTIHVPNETTLSRGFVYE